MDILLTKRQYDEHRAGAGSGRAGRAVARAHRGLNVAIWMLTAGSQYVPLGDNGRLIASLAARVRAARDAGA